MPIGTDNQAPDAAEFEFPDSGGAGGGSHPPLIGPLSVVILSGPQFKVGDTAVPLSVLLTNADGSAVDLSGAAVIFHLKPIFFASAMDTVNAQATVKNAAAGQVDYNWQLGDTAIAGTYYAEWQVVFSDSAVATFPSSGYVAVTIGAELV